MKKIAKIMTLKALKNMNQTERKPWAAAKIISKGEEGQKMFLQTYV
jgi:hypothetical protein